MSELRRPGLTSVVFPAYDEEAGIERALEAARAYLEPRCERWEIVVADDGSTDRTAALVEAAAASDERVRLLRAARNEGKGAAVRRGLAASRGDVVLFLDVDLSTPMEMMDRIWPELDAGAQVVVGSRRMAGADIAVHQPWLRETLGDVFRRVTLAVLGIPVSDITCGFKAFEGRWARALAARMTLADWSYDVELLVAAAQGGARLADVPVVWRDDPDSKVRLSRDLPLAALGVLRVLARRATGRYRSPLLEENSS